MNYIKLGEICNIKSSKRIYQSEYCEKGIPFYRGKEISQLQRGEDIEVELFISKERFKEIREKYGVINKGDLLITSVGTIGNTWVSDGREFYYKDGNITQIEKNDSINTKFISYLFKSDIVKKQYLKGTSGTAQIALTIEKLNKLQIPKIDLRIQNKIVEVLDKAQELIDKRKAQIEALDELVKSQFIEMFGTIQSTTFEIQTLNEICEFIKDGTHQTPTYTDDKVNGFKFISSKDVTSGKIDWSNIKYIPKELHEDLYARIAPKRNDILLAKNGTTGVCAIVETDDIFDIYVSVALLRFKTGYNSKYLWAAINSIDCKRQFDRSLKGVGVPNLHLGEIKKTKIIVPPIELQNQFASFVKQVDKLKFEMQESLKALEDNFNSLMQRSFKGELFK
ncbi:hypothetical protein FC757_00920 [Clostridium botulinum]|nr:hypothetical protein [Clostridium botulinum]NFN68816.1 hypothetical protein [Clostridium botulinum]